MNIIIESSLKTLQNSKFILENLTDETLSSTSVSPYYSSVGSHLRHIFDFYDCILCSDNQIVDLTTRKRDLEVESCCIKAENYLDSILEKMALIKTLDNEVLVIDDLGLGKIKIKYTLSALMAQANSHTIHHYAIINYILDGLNITITDDSFGYNPTTLKAVNLN